MSAPPTLARRLGLTDAVFLGLGAMIGAGVFAVFAPASRSAGHLLLVALALAAVVATCNALSTAQLAAEYPKSGGVYVYGREQLGEWPGFLAGWSFVIGKTASCAAMAMTFAQYAAPEGWERPVAIAAVLALTGLNGFGVTRTAAATRVLVVAVVAVLVVVLVGVTASAVSAPLAQPDAPSLYGVLQAAGLLFFAFAGYARVATMGEEVRDPARTIPRAVVIALAGALVLYLAVGATLLHVLGPVALAAAPDPLAAAARAAGAQWAVPAVAVAAALGSLGALLALIAGVGRTSLAMARERDLPRIFAAIHPRYRVPRRAEYAIAVVVVILLLTVDLREVIGFSSFGVLLYYLVANAAAFTQTSSRRLVPRIVCVVGATGCLVLVATLPPVAVGSGIVVLALGILYRLVVRRSSTRWSA